MQGVVVIKPEEYLQEMANTLCRQVYLEDAATNLSKDQIYPAAPGEGEVTVAYNQFKALVDQRLKENFASSPVQANVERFILNALASQPIYTLDAAATEVVRREAADNPGLQSRANVSFSSGQPIVLHGPSVSTNGRCSRRKTRRISRRCRTGSRR